MLWIFAPWIAVAGAADMPTRLCGAPELIPSILGTARPDIPPPSGVLELRDPFGTPPNIRTSDHFAIKWGSRGGVSAGATTEELAERHWEGLYPDEDMYRQRLDLLRRIGFAPFQDEIDR